VPSGHANLQGACFSGALLLGGNLVAREIVVHLSDGTALNVSKEHEADLHDALSKASRAVTLRDRRGVRNLVNTAHIVRVELRS
jgi:hypothetical protein